MEQGKPDEQTEYAAEGTAAHELGAMCLKNDRHPSEFIGTVIKVGEHSFTVDAEMAGNVNVYVQFVRQQRDLLDGMLVVEEKIDYSRHVDYEGQGGSLDAGILACAEIQVHDLKYGMGEEVHAENNWQLMLYALGLYEKWKEFVTEDVTFRLFIHQPRLRYEPSEWTCKLEDLLALASGAKIAVHRSLILLAPNRGGVTDEQLMRDYLNPGEKQCRWCRAKATCPALAKQVFDTVGATFENLTHPIVDFTTADISDQIEASTAQLECDPSDFLSESMNQVSLIEIWCKAVRAEVERRLVSGEQVMSYKLVKGRKGHRKWKDEAEVESRLKKWRVKHDQIYKYALNSPTAIEALLKKDKPKWWEELQPQIRQDEGKLSVVHESDKRPAETVAVKVEDFADLDLESML
jgi:hypothetical protein